MKLAQLTTATIKAYIKHRRSQERIVSRERTILNGDGTVTVVPEGEGDVRRDDDDEPSGRAHSERNDRNLVVARERDSRAFVIRKIRMSDLSWEQKLTRDTCLYNICL